jgi:hypothetical protein
LRIAENLVQRVLSPVRKQNCSTYKFLFPNVIFGGAVDVTSAVVVLAKCLSHQNFKQFSRALFGGIMYQGWAKRYLKLVSPNHAWVRSFSSNIPGNSKPPSPLGVWISPGKKQVTEWQRKLHVP